MPAAGAPELHSPSLTTDIGVTNGLFAALLDFGNEFNGTPYWLQIGVRASGGGAFTPLSPRQELTPVPYAIFAGSLSSNVNQAFTGTVGFSPSSGPPFTVGNSTKVANLNADLLDGLNATAFCKQRQRGHHRWGELCGHDGQPAAGT